MLHLGNWELLFLVLDEGSIARAADERGLERTRLSRLIAALEKETGVELVERIGRRLMPTQAALEIRPKVEPLIASLHKSLEDLRRGRSMERIYPSKEGVKRRKAGMKDDDRKTV